MNVCAIFYDYPSSSFRDLSVWRKWWQHCHSSHENSINETKWSTDIPSLIRFLYPSIITQSSIFPLPLPPPVMHGWASVLRMSLPFAVEGYSHSVSVISLRFAWHRHRTVVQPTGVRSAAPDLDAFHMKNNNAKTSPLTLRTRCASRLRSHAHRTVHAGLQTPGLSQIVRFCNGWRQTYHWKRTFLWSIDQGLP